MSKNEITWSLLQNKIARHQAKIAAWTAEKPTATAKRLAEIEASISRYNTYVANLNAQVAERQGKVSGKSQRYKDEIVELQKKIDETQVLYNETANMTCSGISRIQVGTGYRNGCCYDFGWSSSSMSYDCCYSGSHDDTYDQCLGQSSCVIVEPAPSTWYQGMIVVWVCDETATHTTLAGWIMTDAEYGSYYIDFGDLSPGFGSYTITCPK